MTFHTLTLVGNHQVADGIHAMSMSVNGWAEVGLATSKSLSEELDPILANISLHLTDVLEKTTQARESMDYMLSMYSTAQSAMLLEHDIHLDALVHGSLDTPTVPAQHEDPTEAIVAALTNLPQFQQTLSLVQGMFDMFKPTLLQVATFVQTFGDQVQETVETFGTTMDRVQKLFDQAMYQLHGTSGEGAEQMEHDTFNLFDIDSSGRVGMDDLHVVAQLYSIYAVDAAKGQELIDHWDADGDGEINEEEFPSMMQDSSVTGIMAVMLREYAKRLSQVAGNVGAARMRSEVSANVVQYFQLVCSKNLTKVAWVSEMLTNGTLPLDFTADIMAELALAKSDPNLLTVADVGQIVVGMMMQINPDYTLQALELMSDPEHWENEGFKDSDLPAAVETVTDWTTTGPHFVNSLEDVMETLKQESAVKGETLPPVGFTEMVSAMPAAARKLTQAKIEDHRSKKLKKRLGQRLQYYGREEQRVFLVELLHGVAATDGGAPDLASRALKAGVPAAPETLDFARWLKNNATETSDRFVRQSFNYTGQSSSTLDAFNTQIKGMVKKLSGLIDILKKYATPANIDKIELMLDEFAENGLKDIIKIVANRITQALGLDKKAPEALPAMLAEGATSLLQIEYESNSNTTDAWRRGQKHDSSIRSHQHSRAGSSKSSSEEKSSWRKHGSGGHLQSMFHHSSSHDSHGNSRSSSSRHHSSHSIHEIPSPKVDMHLEGSLHAAEMEANSGAIAAQVVQPGSIPSAPPEIPGLDGAVETAETGSDTFEQVSAFLRELETHLPQAISIVKEARKEVSAVSETMDTTFKSLQDYGPPIFENAAKLYKAVWTVYFFILLPLLAAILFYSIWASGYCGGPQLQLDGIDGYEAPSGFCSKVSSVCSTICGLCACCRATHDTHMCLWSMLIFWLTIVLIMFLISLVLAVFAGVDVFLSHGCSSIYILNDAKICTETLNKLSEFLPSFILGEGDTPLSMTCSHYNLIVCQKLQRHLLSAAQLSVLGSFAATFLSFELVFSSAMLHEKVVFKRLLGNALDEKKQGESASSA